MKLTLDPLLPHPQSVPLQYRGIWRRTLLATGGQRDTSTTVFWLQTANWHADIRLPDGRPDFSGVTSLANCSNSQLAWLAQQQGFAGITSVHSVPGSEAGSKNREMCTWHRKVDFQPPSGVQDEGFMQFSPGLLVETGVHSDYLEHWIPVEHSRSGFAVLLRTDTPSSATEPAELLLVAGDYVMRVRNRPSAWPENILALRGNSVDWKAYMSLLDCEISFGRRTSAGWQILHSTLPWLEGQHLPVQLVGLDNGTAMTVSQGHLQSWQVLEWSPPG